ncbi:hypothetical protein [Aquimarina sp. MMG015]|nr:hypothetical protein [Aquimarina sp. MMG015]
MKEPSSSMIIVKLQINEGEIKNLMAGGKGILNRQLKIEIDD